jgi:hypothetical protein
MLIGTWNLENLYRPGGAFGPRDEPAYEAKPASLAAVIEGLGPDLLEVQEVGEPKALEDLVKRLGDGWCTVLSEHPDGRGIRVGFLSRTPLAVIADTSARPAPNSAPPASYGPTGARPSGCGTSRRSSPRSGGPPVSTRAALN